MSEYSDAAPCHLETPTNDVFEVYSHHLNRSDSGGTFQSGLKANQGVDMQKVGLHV